MRSFDSFMQMITVAPQHFNECRAKFREMRELESYDFDNIEDSLANLRLLGAPLVEINSGILALETTFCPLDRQKFCIVDIETSGSKPQSDQIIEVGAVIVQGGEIIDRFESFVQADEIPQIIINLTGITVKDTKNAPSIKKVLERFRLFLNSAVFVAHNVNFDYNFISYSMEQAGFGALLNRKICTIDLARRTIKAQKYGLSHLAQEIGIDIENLHRAYGDAYAAYKIFQKSLKNLPISTITTENLIKFSKSKLIV